MRKPPIEYVRVCRVCGFINPQEDAARCAECRSFSGLTTVTGTEANRLVRIWRLRRIRSRLLRISLFGTLVAGLTLSAVIGFSDLGPVPPAATSDISANAVPGSWPQSRRTPQNTGFTPDQPSRPTAVKWDYAALLPARVPPVVAGGRIYLTTEVGRVLALDEESGQLVWEYDSSLPAGSTPAIAGDLVIAPLRTGHVLALHKETGVPVWEQNIKGPVFASPIVVAGTSYVGSGDSNLYALDAATGEVRWTFAATDWIISSVAYHEGKVVVASQGRRVHILGADTGRHRLLYDTGMSRRTAGPAIQGDLVYFPSDGGLLWAINLRARSYPLDRFLWWFKTNLYVWQVISSPPLQRGTVWVDWVDGDIAYTPAVGHGTVFFASTQGKVFAREAATGRERWTTDIGVDITAAPTLAGEVLLLGTDDGRVFGLDAHTGQVVWDFQVGAKVTASPIAVRDTLYVASADGKLRAINGAE